MIVSDASLGAICCKVSQMKARTLVVFGGWTLCVSSLALACGARTGLLSPDEPLSAVDAGLDSRRPDVGRDRDVEVIPDVAQLDVVKLDANRNDCPDAAATLIYVVSQDSELLSFYPPAGVFKTIGKLACPTANGNTPFSMSVDRKGVAYVLYNDGALFKVSTATALCQATSYQVNQQGFTTFGMGFATVGAGPAEQLFVASDRNSGSSLGSIDTMTFKLTNVGPITPGISRAELTGTGDGRLYAFTSDGATGSAISEIDKVTAALVGTDALPTVDQGNGWAFAYWGGGFYLFTGAGGVQTTYQYNPFTRAISVIAHHSSLIVGAGVSTCAPQ